MKLSELTSLIRSKNAGPFNLTFDIMFDDKANYERVKRSGVLNAALIAKLYGCSPNAVRFFICDNALAFKATMPRPIIQADLGDTDLHAGQQFAPLIDIEIP
jgi:hypothetical protein